jgi:hypothetical protein
MKTCLLSVLMVINVTLATNAQSAKQGEQGASSLPIGTQNPAARSATLAIHGNADNWSNCSQLPGAMANGSGFGTDCYVSGLLGNRLLAFDGSPSGQLKIYYVLSQHPRGLGQSAFSEQELQSFYYRRIRMLNDKYPSGMPKSLTRESKLSDLSVAAFQFQVRSFRESLWASFQGASYRGAENRVSHPGDLLTKGIRFPAEWIEDGTMRISDFFVAYLGRSRGTWNDIACKYVRQTGMSLSGYELALRMGASDYLSEKLLDPPVDATVIQDKLRRRNVTCAP